MAHLILSRLEAVTSRLEDLYEHSGNGAPPSSSVPTPAATTTPVPPSAPVQTQVTEDPRSVVAFYEQILKGRVQPFVKLTEAFPNASVVEQVRSVPVVQRFYCLTVQFNPCRRRSLLSGSTLTSEASFASLLSAKSQIRLRLRSY